MSAATRTAAALHMLNGIGFGAFIPAAIARLSSRGEIMYVLGFPTYGQGPFERHGISTTVPLLAGFLIVNLLFVVAGLLLWNGARVGAILGLAVLVPGSIYWWGFALPFGPLLGLAAATLTIIGWDRITSG